jgi:hypothetical protein
VSSIKEARWKLKTFWGSPALHRFVPETGPFHPEVEQLLTSSRFAELGINLNFFS